MVSHFGAAARLLTGLDVRRIAPPQLVPEIVRQRLADNVHTLENLPALTASRIILRPSGPESGRAARAQGADKRAFPQVRLGGAAGDRTQDRRIMRSPARRSRCSTCTDTTESCRRWPSLHCMHGCLGPRTGPRLTAAITGCQLQSVTAARDAHRRQVADYRGRAVAARGEGPLRRILNVWPTSGLRLTRIA